MEASDHLSTSSLWMFLYPNRKSAQASRSSYTHLGALERLAPSKRLVLGAHDIVDVVCGTLGEGKHVKISSCMKNRPVIPSVVLGNHVLVDLTTLCEEDYG